MQLETRVSENQNVLYANAIQVRKCLMYTVAVHLYVSAVCRCIELVLYYRKHDLYAWTVHQTVWSGGMTIIRANCLVQRL